MPPESKNGIHPLAISAVEPSFREAKFGTVPLKELGLTIAESPLEPVLASFKKELTQAGIHRLQPHFYLSTEWGVPFNTISIAIPFYLARPELTVLQAERCGYVEGLNHADMLRYLRHEMGHVVNYGYQLFETHAWVRQFGAITQPYVEEYRPQPFSRRYVHHLPGWYAQKHPDEDWAETFAVWMTPGSNWRENYADWPHALAKLQYCDRTMVELRDLDPIVTATELDEDVGDISYTVEQLYRSGPESAFEFPRGLDGALRAIFADDSDADGAEARKRASALIQRMRSDLAAHVYRWTGHFPERTHVLLRHLADRADRLNHVYPPEEETKVIIALTTLVTALAMNYVHRGSYLP
jgi:hypothetical protein